MLSKDALQNPESGWPNRSVVTSDTGGQALDAIAKVSGFGNKWFGLTEIEDRVRRAILELYARIGCTPDVAQLAEETGMTPEEVRAQLRNLQERDQIVLGEAMGVITGAYPFTENVTGHQVRMSGHVLNAMCAIDALGAGAMYQTDVTIDSFCLGCDTAIRIVTKESGTSLETVSPPSAIVWSGIDYADQCSATSLCTVLAFFCCDAHLTSWRKANREAKGFRLSMEEGFQVGRAIFMDLLAPASSGG